MSYVLYHIKSTEAIKWYVTEKGAKIGTTCSNRNAGCVAYAYASGEEYNSKVVTKIKVKNLMTGLEAEIPSNTPWSCRPDSESYWSS